MRFRPLLALVLALCLTLVTACSGGAKAVDRANLTYDDIHNTGLANDCPTMPDSARGSISLDAGAKYQLREICMHPSEVYVKGEPANKRVLFLNVIEVVSFRLLRISNEEAFVRHRS